MIEKLEALELEHAERMEVEETSRGGVRQGRSEMRRFQREVMNAYRCPRSSSSQTLMGLPSRQLLQSHEIPVSAAVRGHFRGVTVHLSHEKR